MKIMPMGDYYVWHCDWCDSTNYTLWARIDGQKITCAACHQKFFGFAGSASACNRQRMPDSGFNNIAL
jgi:hypothetical protein